MFSSLLFLLPRVLWKMPAQHWRGNSETAELCSAPWSRGIGRKSGSKGEGAGDRKTRAGGLHRSDPPLYTHPQCGQLPVGIHIPDTIVLEGFPGQECPGRGDCTGFNLCCHQLMVPIGPCAPNSPRGFCHPPTIWVPPRALQVQDRDTQASPLLRPWAGWPLS